MRRAALFSFAGCFALASCSTTSVMGLSKASYVNGELEELNAKTEEIDRLEAKVEELSALEEKMAALDGEVAGLNESVEEVKAADEELRVLAAEFAKRLDELSRDTLLELVEAIMEHLDSSPTAE